MGQVTRKERKREQQRDEIVLAARELLLRVGHEEFSMRKLAGEVGCVPGTLYLYFRDRTELVAAVVEESFEELMVELERCADPDPLVFLKGMMHAYIRFGIDKPDPYHFAFMLRRTKGLEKARPRPHRSFAFLQSVVSDCIQGGLLRKVDPQLATQGIWAGIHGVTSLMITIPRFPWGDRDAVIEHVVSSLIEGLRP